MAADAGLPSETRGTSAAEVRSPDVQASGTTPLRIARAEPTGDCRLCFARKAEVDGLVEKPGGGDGQLVTEVTHRKAAVNPLVPPRVIWRDEFSSMRAAKVELFSRQWPATHCESWGAPR